MRLLEFFNPSHEHWKKNHNNEDIMPRDDKLEDNIYYFILDDDGLHKEHYLPLAVDYYRKKDHDNFDKKEFVKKCLPMVRAGCKAYCQTLKSEDEIPTEQINKELIRNLAHRILDQIINDVKEDAYGFKDLFE